MSFGSSFLNWMATIDAAFGLVGNFIGQSVRLMRKQSNIILKIHNLSTIKEPGSQVHGS